MAEINAMDSDDDNLSVHSAISNPSDFEEDEEVDYLALELLHHLPSEKADKLMKSLRAKEKAVQDLVSRNRSLLNNCQALDDENQALTDRLKEAEETPAKVPDVAPAPSTPVDNSIFLQMERGKEETILRLTNENRKLVEQVKRLGDGYKQMEEALLQTRKEIKRAQQQSQPKEPQVRLTGGSSVLDEEERLYRELQGESMGDLVMQKLQEKQAEHRVKIQAALQASLTEEIGRIESWGSDVKGVLLAVDGLEAQLKHQLKEPKSAKKAKANDAKANESRTFNTEQITAVSAQLLDEFDAMKGLLEVVDKEQLSLEQTVRAASDGAEPLAVTLDLDSGLASAESEAEWLREHNAAWVHRCQSLSLQPMLDVLLRTDAAFTDLLSKAPPGLMPTNVEDCLQETRSHMKELSGHLQEQMASISDLQEESAALGRTVRSLQAAQKSHRAELRQNVSESVKRMVASFDQPLDDMRTGLRQQSQALSKARSQVSKLLEDLAATAHRVVLAQGPAKDLPSMSSEGQDNIMSEIRQVRSMGKKLVSNLEEGCKAVEKRMHQVIEAISGEAPKSHLHGRQAAVQDAGEKESTAEAKKKHKKKKGSSAAKGNANGKDAEEDPKGEQRSQNEPPKKAEEQVVGLEERQKSSEAEEPKDADAQLRAEFQEAFESTPGSKSKKRETTRPEKVLAGTDLLQELESLRSGTEALEARMAERLQARANRADEDDPDAAKPNPARRRKKMFV